MTVVKVGFRLTGGLVVRADEREEWAESLIEVETCFQHLGLHTEPLLHLRLNSWGPPPRRTQ